MRKKIISNAVAVNCVLANLALADSEYKIRSNSGIGDIIVGIGEVVSSNKAKKEISVVTGFHMSSQHVSGSNFFGKSKPVEGMLGFQYTRTAHQICAGYEVIYSPAQKNKFAHAIGIKGFSLETTIFAGYTSDGLTHLFGAGLSHGLHSFSTGMPPICNLWPENPVCLPKSIFVYSMHPHVTVSTKKRFADSVDLFVSYKHFLGNSSLVSGMPVANLKRRYTVSVGLSIPIS